MFALLAALALQATSPPMTHHVVLHVGGHTTLTVHHAHLRRWSVANAGVVSLSDIRSMKTDTTVRLTATSPGSTSILVGCDHGEEVWLVDVT